MSEDRRMEAEQRYVSGDETLAALGKEMGIPLNTIKRWCKQGDWVKKREKAKRRAMKKAITRATDKKARELARLIEASDEMEKALLLSAKAIAEIAGEHPKEFALTQSDVMLNYSKSLEKLASARTMTGGAMTSADREKLDLLRRKQEMDERKEAQQREQDSGGAVIRLAGGAEDLIG